MNGVNPIHCVYCMWWKVNARWHDPSRMGWGTSKPAQWENKSGENERSGRSGVTWWNLQYRRQSPNKGSVGFQPCCVARIACRNASKQWAHCWLRSRLGGLLVSAGSIISTPFGCNYQRAHPWYIFGSKGVRLFILYISCVMFVDERMKIGLAGIWLKVKKCLGEFSVQS